MKLNDESLVIDIAQDMVGDIRPQLVESDDPTWYSTNYEAEIQFIAWPAPVANAGGPYAGYEGQIIELDASKSTASTSDLSYRWDFGNDGTWDYSSTDPRAVYTLPDAGVVNVLLEVSDGTMSGTATTTVTVNNMSPSALITSVTGVISSSSKPGKILILGDGYSEGDVAKGPIIGTADVLKDAGFTVDIAPVKSDSWTGDNPSLDDYALVILLVGADTKSSSSGDVTLSDMPQSGQTALMRFVMNGGGLVFGEWISLQIRDYGYYTGFQDLVMLDWNKWDEQKSADTYNVKANHPITKGLSSSFLAPYHWYSSGVAKPGATVLIQGTNPHKYDAVMVKQFNAGRVVEFSWANNWAEYIEHLSPWSDNMKTLYTNAASWASGRMGVSSLTAIQGDELTFNVESSDTGLNQDLAYTFTWGDGSTSIVTIPATGSFVRTTAISHTYVHGGHYIAVLSVSDNYGEASLLSTVEVTILREPIIANAGPNQTVDEGTNITYDGSQTTSGGDSPLTYAWDFGDGTPIVSGVDLINPTHLYTDDGLYTVTLTVTDDDGGVGSDSLTVTVNNVVPTVEAGANLASDEGSPVVFAGGFTDPGADTHTIAWVFGDGATTTGSLTPTHTYTDDGVYTVTLTVTDKDGGVGADTLTVTVGDLAPSAAFTWAPEPQGEGSPTQFTDASTSSPDAIVFWVWTIDGQTFIEQSPAYAFMENGAYTVTLTVTDNDGSTSTVSHLVNVVNVAPNIEAGAGQTSDEGSPVTFAGGFTDLGAIDTHTYLWDFGDGATTTGSLTPTHTYTDDGVYTVKLTVTDDDGGVGSDSLTVTVNNVVPTVEAGANLASDEGSPVTFSGSFTDPGADTHTIVWVFGDGATATGTLTPTHTYVDNGVYTVTLTVTDDDGGVGVDTLTVTVNNVAPTVDAGPDVSQYVNAMVTFTGDTSDPGVADILTYEWDFGDGALSASGIDMKTITHTYAVEGIYTVTLTVTDKDSASASDTTTATITVMVNHPPVANAGPDVEAMNGVPITLDGSATTDPDTGDILTYAWDFGDGSAIISGVNLKTPTHTYIEAGVYTVTLTVTDDADAAGNTATDSITVTILSIEVPTTSISLSGTQSENGWYTSNVAVTLNAEGDTFKAIHYSVDGGTENVLTSTDASFTLTTEEVHTITYYSVSVAGLAEDEQIAEVKMDWTAPTVQITSPTQGQVFTPTSTINLQYTVTDNVDANPTITVDPSSFPSPLPLGDLTITITATDAAGNTATKSITVKVQETTVKTPRQLKNDAKSLLLGSKTGIRDIDYAIDAAVALIDKSLNPHYWIDDSHLKDDHGIKVFIYEGKAAGGLQTSATLYDKSIPTLQKLIDQMARQHKDTTQQRARLAAMQKLIPIFKEAVAMLAEADEGLAKTALDEANALTPPKNGSSFATALKNAEKEYNDGLTDEAAGNPTKAIEDFKQSWIHSRQAAHIQGGDKHWNGGSEC